MDLPPERHKALFKFYGRINFKSQNKHTTTLTQIYMYTNRLSQLIYSVFKDKPEHLLTHMISYS